jgi:hypothetical protein
MRRSPGSAPLKLDDASSGWLGNARTGISALRRGLEPGELQP